MNRYQEKLATDVRTDGRTHNHKCTGHPLPRDPKNSEEIKNTM